MEQDKKTVMIRYVDEIEVKGKQIFIRTDYNVPLDSGTITDDTRIKSTLPTIKSVLDREDL